MPEVLLPRYPVYARETGLICSAPNIILRDSLNRQPTVLQANTPYMVGEQVRPGDLDVLSILSASNATADLSLMTEEFGSDGVQILASLQDHMAATFSSGASVYGDHESWRGGFGGCNDDHTTRANSFIDGGCRYCGLSRSC